MFTFNAENLENSFGQLGDVGLNLELVEVFQAMKIYTSMLEAYIDGCLVDPDLIQFCDQRNLIQHQLLSLPSADNLSGISLQKKQVYEVCRISGIIYSIGVIFPLPGLTTPLTSLSRTLKHHLQYCDLNLYLSLTDLIDIFLWAITIGGVAATGTHERQWFVKSLKRVAAAAQLDQWSDLKRSLKRILWLDNACDNAGQQVWNEAEQQLHSSEGCLAKASQTITAESPVQHRALVRREPPCKQCRKRKVRCDKKMPCQNCRRCGFICSYDTPLSNLRKRVTDLEDQLADINLRGSIHRL